MPTDAPYGPPAALPVRWSAPLLRPLSRQGGPERNNGTVTDAPDSAAASPQPTSNLDPQVAARLRRDADGLIPAVIQQHDTGDVLMVGWMDDEALHRTLTDRLTTFWSRSRGSYWLKGEVSGNRQYVEQVRLDCDGDTLLISVSAAGPACHTGTRTCFDDRMLPLDTPPQRTSGAGSEVS